VAEDDPVESQPSILGSSAVMAAGTTVSRLTGYVRNALLAAALGLGLHADIFNYANTIPNSLYILLAGGVFNAVLVPQLVRAMRRDEDHGDAYTHRIVTLAAAFLAVATVVLVASRSRSGAQDGRYYLLVDDHQNKVAGNLTRWPDEEDDQVPLDESVHAAWIDDDMNPKAADDEDEYWPVIGKR